MCPTAWPSTTRFRQLQVRVDGIGIDLRLGMLSAVEEGSTTGYGKDQGQEENRN